MVKLHLNYNKVELLVKTPKLMLLLKLSIGEETIPSKKVRLPDMLVMDGLQVTTKIGLSLTKIMLPIIKTLLDMVKMLLLWLILICTSIKDKFTPVEMLGDKLRETTQSLIPI